MTSVLVTRPLDQAETLAQLLESRGMQAIRMPLVEIQPIALPESELSRIACDAPYNWLIFISRNAVNFTLVGNNGKILDYCRNAKRAAVGRATANALQQLGLSVDLMPAQNANSEALLAMPDLQSVRGQRCLIARGEGGRELLAETLRSRGAEVRYVEVYRRRCPHYEPKILLDMLSSKTLDVITITSAEVLQNLLAQLPSSDAGLLFEVPVVVISDRLHHIASALGFRRITVSPGVSDDVVFNTIIDLVSGEYSG